MADILTPVGYWHPDRGTFTTNERAAANSSWVSLHTYNDVVNTYDSGYQAALNDCVANGIDWARSQVK